MDDFKHIPEAVGEDIDEIIWDLLFEKLSGYEPGDFLDFKGDIDIDAVRVVAGDPDDLSRDVYSRGTNRLAPYRDFKRWFREADGMSQDSSEDTPWADAWEALDGWCARKVSDGSFVGDILKDIEVDSYDPWDIPRDIAGPPQGNPGAWAW